MQFDNTYTIRLSGPSVSAMVQSAAWLVQSRLNLLLHNAFLVKRMARHPGEFKTKPIKWQMNLLTGSMSIEQNSLDWGQLYC